MKKRDLAGIAGLASTTLVTWTSSQADEGAPSTAEDPRAAAQTFTNTFLNADARNLFASHRSHSSHRSHQSHASGSGGSRPAQRPAPVYGPPPETQPAQPPAYAVPQTPPSDTSKPPQARPPADELKLMIMRVQLALLSRGYDPGAIDGALGPTTTAALRRFQADKKLPVTGTMTTETLTALGVTIGQ